MKTLIRNARIRKNLKTREVAQLLGVDQALVSKFESGTRFPTEDQVKKLSEILSINYDIILVIWLKEKIMREVGYYNQYALEAVNMVQEELAEYKRMSSFEYSERLELVLNDIDKLKARLDEIRHMDNFRIAQALELEYTFESNRIEGNTLTLRETDLIVNEGLTISGKSMREHLEAINHKDAIDYVKELASKTTDLNEREVLTIHNLILRGIQPENAGKYRRVQVMIQGSTHMPPQPYLVQKEMEDYFLWYRRYEKVLHPVVLAAEMHERLVTIHPFIDGNGRTARLVMNLILLRHGYVIANIKGEYQSRMEYYTALETVQTSQNRDAFCLFSAHVEKAALERYLSIIDC